MRKLVVSLLLLCFLGGALSAEAHVLGFGCLDVDVQGTNQTAVYLMYQDSPAASKGGLMLNDILLSVNGNDLRGMMWRDIPVYTKSDKPTTFNFTVLRNGKETSVSLTSVPVSTMTGKKQIVGDQMTINPNLRELKFPFEAYNGRISSDLKSIVNNQVTLRIRYAGEKWWLYEKTVDLDSEGKFTTTPVTIVGDVTRLFYVEMVYLDKDGKYYGDYKYKSGSDMLWGRGYDRIVLFNWRQFTRFQSLPDWTVLMGQSVKVRGSYSIWMKDKSFDYYNNQGYVFPDHARLTILDNNNKQVFDQDFKVDYGWDKKVWSIASSKFMYEIPNQNAETDYTLILTVNAEKDGKIVPLTFKTRETTYTGRSIQGLFRDVRSDVVYYFDEKGQLSKIRN